MVGTSDSPSDGPVVAKPENQDGLLSTGSDGAELLLVVRFVGAPAKRIGSGGDHEPFASSGTEP